MSALETLAPVTIFRDYAASEKHEELWTLCALAPRIRAVTAPQKSRLPWLKLARFGDLRSDKKSLRHDANVLAVTGIEADYDGGKIAFDAALELLEKQGIAALTYTSPSHAEDAPRWRILCPFSEEVAPDKRRQLLGRLNGLFGGIFSRESWALSQSYYFGSVNHNPSHRAELIDGTPIDQHDDLDAIWTGPGNAQSERGAPDGEGSGDEREIAELVQRALTGAELHTALLPLAARLIARNVPAAATAEILRGVMLAWPESARNKRWRARYAEIGRLVESAVGKYGAAAEQRRQSHRELSRLGCRLVRDGVPSSEILRRLDSINAELVACVIDSRFNVRIDGSAT
jgi:hypothetical protein